MFGAKQQKLRREYDDRLLETIERVKEEWDHAKQTELAVADVDEEITSQTKLARQKYLFLYREARLRQVHGHHIQASVFDF
ncbi:YaaL family protein [Secundilactobacillus muriivasis]